MLKRLKLQDNRIALHLMFWGAFFTFLFTISLLRSNAGRDVDFHLPFELLHVALTIFVVYLNLRVLIPRLYESGKYPLYGLVLLSSVVVNAFLIVSIIRFFPDFKPPYVMHNRPSYMFSIPMIFMQLFMVGVTSALHFMRENLILQREALSTKDLESSKLKAELDSLKAQVNPHFLFNSLNNIYSHSLLESPKTPELILKLSGLLNHIIYECEDEEVPLEKEMEFLTNYLALEKVRIDESVRVNLKMDVTDTTKLIAPLLFVPLIENAFKHGVNISNGNPFINIELTQSESHLKFSCTNLRDHFEGESRSSGGIGLENVRKRLELIYPGTHKFEIEQDDQHFSTELTIPLGTGKK
ncbi:MAG: histidine kinase [FCB group bacterium]|nr:histidine kinase [FCB group bacterium]